MVRGCSASEIVAISSSSVEHKLTACVLDDARDLALLTPKAKLDGGLTLDLSDDALVGERVCTWGFPLGYNGPAPLLSVGYLAGFMTYETDTGLKKHLVVNGAFNQGNSGGPVFKYEDDKVIGVVVTKHAPFTEFQISALKALRNNKSGPQFRAKHSSGEVTSYAESQLVADLLDRYRDLAQVMIGEAISPGVVKDFLTENSMSA